MTAGCTSDDVEVSGAESADRLWILVNARSRARTPERPHRGERRTTVVVRDRDNVLISIAVGGSSSLAVPFRPDELGCSEVTLVVRIAAGSTPCAGCVDDSLTSSAAARGGLDAAGIFRAVRAAIVGCSALRGRDPAHGVAIASERPPDSAGARSYGALRLAPPNAPHVPAGSGGVAEGDVDVILII